MNELPAPLCVDFAVGAGLGLVGASTCALFDSSAAPIGERLWARISTGAGIDELVDELSADGLSKLGSFALAQFEGDDLRVVVRGDALAAASGSHGDVRLEASSVKTWLEQVVTACSRFELSLTAVTPGPGGFRAAAALLPATSLKWPPSNTFPALLTNEMHALLHDVPVPAGGRSTSDPNGTPPPAPRPALGNEPGVTIHPSRITDVGADTLGTQARGPGSDDAPLDVDDYDALYGQTMARSVQGAAVGAVEETPAAAPGGEPASDVPDPVGRPAAPGGVVAPPPGLISAIPPGGATTEPVAPGAADDGGDHDGLTISAAQLRAMRSATAGSPSPSPPHAMPAMGGPTVQALMCASESHPNPPHLSTCSRCGAALADELHTIARPSMGKIRLTTGDVIELTRPAILGRNPKLEGRLQGEMPQTVRIDVGREISRSHAMVRLEGWQVLVEDLGSANGTTVTLPGRLPQRLHAGEPILLEHGALIDLGGEVTGTFDAWS